MTKPTTHQHINFPCEACKNFQMGDDWELHQDICPVSLKKGDVTKCPPLKWWWFKKGEDIGKCEMHGVADPMYPLDRIKPDGVPHLVVAVLGLHYQAKHYTDEQIRSFAEKISLAGVDYVRIMATWDCPDYQAEIETSKAFAYRTTVPGGQPVFNLDVPLNEFDFQLNRLRQILELYHIKIWFDLFDNCSEICSPWANNEQGVFGTYDPSPTHVAYAKTWLRRLERVFPASEGHIIGFGNEMQYGDDQFSAGMDQWCLDFVRPMGEEVIKSYPFIPFSGALRTGHRLHGVLSPDVPMISVPISYTQAPLIVHGLGLPEDLYSVTQNNLRCGDFSGQRSYGYSDDGVWVRDPSKQGRPTDWGQAHPANTEWRVKMIQEMVKCVPQGLYSIEFLPRILSGPRSPDQITTEDLEVYAEVCRTVYNFDPRRHYAS